LGHHGPAIENEWLGLRYYFDKKAAIDVYSKSRNGLELREARWYPSIEQQENGWGADYYKVGSTVGLGGIRLWDGEKVIPLDPVTNRSARVVKQGSTSKMEIRSENIPCKGVRLISLFVLLFFPENGRPRLKQSHWVMTLYSLLQVSIIMMDKK